MVWDVEKPCGCKRSRYRFKGKRWMDVRWCEQHAPLKYKGTKIIGLNKRWD